jgi:DNA-binding NarL/FixJ family response regulator
MRGELLWRKSRVAAVEAVDETASAYRFALLKDWTEAAAEFERRRMPYEQAIMLLRGDVDSVAKAASIIERLGATALRSELDAALQSQSRRRGATVHPRGLTNREVQVLQLLGQGYTNAELADKLCLSAKTIDHHVSAILGKLQVRSRAHAVTVAYELGMVKREADSG